MTPIGQHRDDYDDENDFFEDVYTTGMTAGAAIATLERCGLRPRDIGPALGLPPDADPDWADGCAPICASTIEIVARIDGVRVDVRDGIIERHRDSRTPVILTIHRTTPEARRAFIEADAGRAYHTDRLVPDFAAVHRVATVEACDALIKLGVFAVVQFDHDPKAGAVNHTSTYHPDPTRGDDCPFD
jgi:hypothetical protein